MHGLKWVDQVRITSVVDNFVDLLLADEGVAKRRPRPEKVYERGLCCEHGLAEIVDSTCDGDDYTLMFDFGASPAVFLNNLKMLIEDYDIDLAAVRALVLSHGHWDHFGGLCGFLDERRDELPEHTCLYAGEDAFQQRWVQPKNGPLRDHGRLDEAYIAGKAIEIIRVAKPRVLSGQVLVSGEIVRRTAYEVPSPAARIAQENGGAVLDELLGEQALIYQLEGKGLVVLTACGHAGVVNTVLHAQEITGVDKVHAVIGGFHLSNASEERIGQTVEDLAGFDPDLIVPMHCTGLQTIEALKQRLPGRIIYNSAGTRYALHAA